MSFIAAVSSTICFILLAFFLYDWCVRLNTWQKRIHIGRWPDLLVWKNAVQKCAIRWIINSPVVPAKDQDRLLLWDRINSNFENNTIQSWQSAGIILGLSSSNYIFDKKSIDCLINRYASNKNVDKGLLAYSLLNLECVDLETRKQIESFADLVYEQILSVKGDAATVPYRTFMPEVRFVDTLGFICPFLALYAVKNEQLHILDLVERQLCEYKSFFHPDLHLPPHAYNLKNSSPMGVYDWGRGIGWYILAIVETRRVLYNNSMHDIRLYNILSNAVIEMADRICKYQRSNGSFSMFITDYNPSHESSATVLCGLLLDDAYKLTGNENYRALSDKTLKALMSVTQRSGAIDLCQGDTKGISLYSSRLAVMPFVQGLAILLANRHGENR